MNCPQCGHPAEDYEAFCTNCGHYILPLQDQGRPVATSQITEDGTSRTPPVEFPQPEKKVAQRVYPPPAYPEAQEYAAPQSQQPSQPRNPRPQTVAQQASEAPVYDYSYSPAPPVAPGSSKRLQRMKTLAITFGCIALIATAVAAYVLITTSSLRVQLNKAQRETVSAQSSASQLEQRIENLTADLDAANQEKNSLSQQVSDLNAQIGNLETDVNQSQYDKDAAVRDMDELRTNLAAAEETNTALETQLEEANQALTTVQDEKAALEEEAAGYRDQVAFFDDHVVFVMLSASDKYYHRYSCSQFTKKNFLSYSTKLAESNGYTPCPECFGAE